ncbi:MAG: quinolinate synthase [Deltaproteobacteria bacterium RBG_13_49_15]|nr:MAG: quinolinate synthase [Deltaproteobacteria bacterium RBG_13_49_15]
MDEQKKKVRRLLKERNAIMLAHNYQPPEIQEVADLCGDSLELSRKAAKTDAEIILFCGVHFMAETASILSPDKTVLLPRLDAGCPMADMITAKDLEHKLKELPPMPVVTYVNSTADVKALSTICCTSANAVQIVNSLDVPEVLMIPDRNLARYTAARTKKKVHYWNGYCPIHDRLKPEELQKAKNNHPDALFMAHPECRPEILEMADAILSTSGMLKFAGESDRRSFIVGTEVGILYPLKKSCPGKNFFPASETMVCPNMKKMTLTDIIRSLEHLEGEVKVDEKIRLPALEAVRRMIELSV